jgi:hypothetical protein
MFPDDSDSEALCRAAITDRIREAEHRRLVREIRRSELPDTTGAATASTHRRTRLLELVHLSHAYG